MLYCSLKYSATVISLPAASFMNFSCLIVKWGEERMEGGSWKEEERHQSDGTAKEAG
jgi:hypothetical protein